MEGYNIFMIKEPEFLRGLKMYWFEAVESNVHLAYLREIDIDKVQSIDDILSLDDADSIIIFFEVLLDIARGIGIMGTCPWMLHHDEIDKIFGSFFPDDFYTFWKQLQTLKKVIGENATLILRTDRGLLSPLNKMPEPPSAPLRSPRGASASAPPPTDQAAAPAEPREETP